MTALSGLGIWIWQLPLCEGGDLARIAVKARRCGVSWVAVKSGDARPTGQVSRKVVDTLRAGGIECAAWFYSVPGTVETAQQLEHGRHLIRDCGVNHIFIDAELEWESRVVNGKRVPADRRAEARAFAPQFRAAVGPDTWLADAPWPICKAHPQWPWREFMEGCQLSARCDQLYFTLSEQTFATFAAHADANWAQRPTQESSIRCPIAGCFDWTNPTSGKTWKRTAQDLAAFMTRYIDRPLRSIWSWQHMTEAEWALLETLAADRTLDPRNALVGLPNAAIG